MSPPLVVVGDALLDVDLVGTAERLSPDAPVAVVGGVSERARPGGAALAALLAAGAGARVVLVCPLADDPPAARLRSLLPPYLELVALPWTGTTPVKTRVRADGQSLVRVDTGGDVGTVRASGRIWGEVAALLAAAAGVLVADYGRGVTGTAALRAALGAVPPRVPLVWDPHPRGADPVPGVRLATPNGSEAREFAARLCRDRTAGGAPRWVPATTALAAAGRDAVALVRAWEAGAVAVTLGERGALVSSGSGAPLVVPASPARGGDACGAGDAFAAAAVVALAAGALPSEAVESAVRSASGYVAAGGAAAVGSGGPVGTGDRAGFGTVRPDPAGVVGDGGPATSRDALAVAARVRAAGGTVVATGGCFDLLHAGHVATLRAARALGDCLVVCLNSDASVRRLKGGSADGGSAQRPLQRQADRMRVLEALSCVDAVLVFDEDTPEAALERLRPDVWAKGGDYAGVELPESRILARWGGSAVVLPYLPGRSTSRIVDLVRTSLPLPGAVRREPL